MKKDNTINSNELEFTGERVVPGRTELMLLDEHLARYRLALQYAKGAKTMDAASGTGYGCFTLATESASVTGIDISEEAVKFARLNFNADNIEFVVGDVLSLPFEDNSFDLVTAFEILEHVTEPEKFLLELRRIVKNDGCIIVSTPNLEFCKTNEPNPFHVKEYTLKEFRQVLADTYKGKIKLLGQVRYPPKRSLMLYYINLKRMFGIGPILKKRPAPIATSDETLSMKISSEFITENLHQSAFFVAVIELQEQGK